MLWHVELPFLQLEHRQQQQQHVEFWVDGCGKIFLS
jgi:hypothetical protein